jgi:hypothetical protein
MRSFREPYPFGSSRAALAPLPSDHVDPVVLAANVSQARPVPAGAQYVVFSFDGDFYARFGESAATAAAVPGASATNGQGSELNPAARRIPAGLTHIALIADAPRKGSLAFYA